jgi:hypothetical protein
MVSVVEGMFERKFSGGTHGGVRLLVVLGGELSVGKIENRISMASAGWGDATTNRYLLGRMARRAMTIGEDAVASFVPSDFGAKINITKFVVGIGGRQSMTARNNQPN